MSNRGTMVVRVHRGLAAVLAALGPDYDPGVELIGQDLILLEVTARHELDLILDGAPQATWQAWCDGWTELPNRWIGHHPGLGELWAHSTEVGEVLVPVSRTDPAGRTGEQERWLADFDDFIAVVTEIDAADPLVDVAPAVAAHTGEEMQR